LCIGEKLGSYKQEAFTKKRRGGVLVGNKARLDDGARILYSACQEGRKKVQGKKFKNSEKLREREREREREKERERERGRERERDYCTNSELTCTSLYTLDLLSPCRVDGRPVRSTTDVTRTAPRGYFIFLESLRR
jgi:hypothetical protein